MKYFIIFLIIVIVAALGAWIYLAGKNSAPKVSNPNPTASSQEQTPAPLTNKGKTPVTDNTSKPAKIILETNFGKIEIALDYQAAPKTSENFAKLAQDGFYNNLTFHRIVPGFVIQGGDPKGDGTGGPGYDLPPEIKAKHVRGAVAMARQGGPPETTPSSGSQFYIALADLPQLDGQYTVFGKVTSGMDVVDKIAQVKTGANDRPVDPVKILKAYISN